MNAPPKPSEWIAAIPPGLGEPGKYTTPVSGFEGSGVRSADSQRSRYDRFASRPSVQPTRRPPLGVASAHMASGPLDPTGATPEPRYTADGSRKLVLGLP